MDLFLSLYFLLLPLTKIIRKGGDRKTFNTIKDNATEGYSGGVESAFYVLNPEANEELEPSPEPGVWRPPHPLTRLAELMAMHARQ